MATASEIADRALELAAGFLDGSSSEIADLAGDDGKVLYDAAQIVRGRAEGGPHSAHSAEHLAFSLITAAHEQLRREQPLHPAAERQQR